jgi:hypothetical protein
MSCNHCTFSTTMVPKKTFLSLLSFLHMYIALVTAEKAPRISVVSPIDPRKNRFSENINRSFSWTDPELQKRLWAGLPRPDTNLPTHQLEKRALGKTFGPALRILSCLGCAGQSSNTAGQALLDEMTTEYFVQNMILFPPQLVNKCVFYTSRTPLAIPLMGYSTLSEIATNWACQNNKISIWVCTERYPWLCYEHVKLIIEKRISGQAKIKI